MTQTTAHTSHKNFGLDLVRASAVAMVFIFHLSFLQKLILIAPPTPPGIINFDGFFQFIGIGGVNLFFVLSGFLIGQIVLRDILPHIATPQLWSALRRFYVRRWLRTIPAYYVVLSSMALWHLINGDLANVSYGLRHYFFLQEDALRARQNAILGVSWTLAAEEWFYFFLPLVFCIFCSRGLLHPLWQKLRLPRWSPHLRSALGTIIIGFITVAPCIAVMWLVFYGDAHHAKPFHWMRFGGLPVGVILAILKIYYAPIYKKLATPLALFLAAITIALIIGYIQPMSESFMAGFRQGRVFFQPWLNPCWMIIIVAAERSQWINDYLANTTASHVVRVIALRSYSIYLVHFPCIQLAEHITTNIWAASLIAFFFTAAVSALLYRYVERPFMEWREKIA